MLSTVDDTTAVPVMTLLIASNCLIASYSRCILGHQIQDVSWGREDAKKTFSHSVSELVLL